MDALCAKVASRQDGAISVGQMRAAGLGRGGIHHRRRTGRIHPLTRGVYAWGHAKLGPRGPLWVAHLATAEALARETAAWAWDILPPSRPLHVVTTTSKRSRRGILVHTSDTLLPGDVTSVDGLPLTTVERTIFDLPPALTGRAIREARFRRLLDERRLRDLLGRHPAARRLGPLLERNRLPHRTRSEFEHEVLDTIADHGLPQPLVNVMFAGRERDLFWPEHGLVAELDGEQHDRDGAPAIDRARDRELLVRTGVHTVRFDRHDPLSEVARVLSALLVP